ncbi:eama-like protein 5 [Dermatophagoides farinae]|uniref:Eama-like protein 5 n=1 Tax=Dermatophagoides farinae TaxID=6954 RepID=A0A9D4P7G3_DERFA|nr:eama-like protein 5 [Dermatophagoides farinae]
MPLLKPNIMSDILSTPELSRFGLAEAKINMPSTLASSQSSIDIRTSNTNSKLKSIPERIPAFGLLMAILSVFCFSIASVIVRILVSLPTIEILVWRSLCQFVVYFATTLVYGYNFFGQPGHRLDLFYRSISGTISLSAVYIAYRLIPLSDASTIHFASPVFVTVFAYFLLKEPLSKLQIITGTITLTGVFIIAKPEFIFGSESDVIHEMRLEGIVLSVIASMTAAFSMIALRKLKTTPVAVVVMWYSFTLVSTPELSRFGLAEAKINNMPSTLASSQSSIDIRTSNTNNKLKSIPERIPAFGLLMANLSVFCFSIASVIVRILVSLPTIEILVWRSLCQFVICFYRSISGTISLSAVYIAYRLIPLSDASTIHFASPVFVTVFAYFLLKEPLSKLQIITGTITLTGVFIIAKPEFIFGSESDVIHEMRLEGIVLSVIASMTAAFSMIALRKLKTTPVAVVVMWYSFTLVVCGSTYLTIANKWIMPNTTQIWSLLIAIGICGILDQYCITLAFQYEKAGPISVVRTFNIVLSFLWEVMLLNEDIEWTSILGACLICSCVIVLALVKWYKESPESFEKIRRKLCCFCPAPGPKPKPKSKSSLSSSSSSSSSSKRNKKINNKSRSRDINNQSSSTVDFNIATTLDSTMKKHKKNGSNESIDSITVQNTVNSNAILLIKSDDDDDDE